MDNRLTIPTAEPFLFPGGKTGCILVHGFTGAPKEMRLMGEALNQKGLTVLGVRLTGHATRPEDLIRTRWRDWLASVEDGINILNDICDRVFIAGLSLGGMLSLIAASRYTLKGVIAIATPYELPKDWRLKIARPLSLIFPWTEKGQSETKDQSAVKEHVDYPAYPTRSISEVYDLTKILHQSLPRINNPVLLINSRIDGTVPLSHANKILAEIGSEKVEQFIIDESGHVITEDFGREVVFEVVHQFIQRNSK